MEHGVVNEGAIYQVLQSQQGEVSAKTGSAIAGGTMADRAAERRILPLRRRSTTGHGATRAQVRLGILEF